MKKIEMLFFQYLKNNNLDSKKNINNKNVYNNIFLIPKLIILI